ncbi:unnamed protein product [Blepharisma stoltei]|uniref:FYVE-type domain-containing protein n=1 Tax=Blepharisma stoltei TaxID=1481888 RepID=A0AAU9JI17_9CILI|nr:unnamed protein product [Blepharisma stoltei]
MGPKPSKHIEYDRNDIKTQGYISITTKEKEKKKYFRLSHKSLKYSDGQNIPSKNKAFFDKNFKIRLENPDEAILVLEVKNIRGQIQQWQLKFETNDEYISWVSLIKKAKRPIWEDPIENLACKQCNVDFSVSNRQHHCRKCGKVYCYLHSSNKIAIPELEYNTPVRVCDNCFKDS